MRAIDANALIGTLHNVTFEDGTDREIIYRCIELAPTIEVRKTGKWITVRKGTVECSACGWFAPQILTGCQMNGHFEPHITPYCSHCGAKMEVDE